MNVSENKTLLVHRCELILDTNRPVHLCNLCFIAMVLHFQQKEIMSRWDIS